jgi:NADH-quinone oxidoreductase subunit L
MAWSEYAYLIPLIPFVCFLLVAFLGKKIREGGAPIAIGGVAASFVLSLLVFFDVLQNGSFETSMEWFANSGFEIGILVDELSVLMAIVVSFVSLMVVIYSVGYMHGDDGLRRYYAEICLFVGSMLGLILANNYLLMFIFWELVGVCSYLLIGFWFKKPEAASAAKKAFLVTRVGDVLFLIGIVMLYSNFGTFNFELLSQRMGADVHFLLLPALLIFGGAVGKSAQFPLHVWLPDAMEGPTTVSALIHAATMVNAGIYLVARSFPLLTLTPDALLVIATIGGITALIAASMALVQNDIKRVLAYSTISQLGYMTLALGTGFYVAGYTAGIFHLMNHAFFKGLLFLGAGSVIHAVGTNDMRMMGGLHSKMKITSITMLIAALSISGVPFFSGFFSKDEVLSSVFHAGSHDSIFFILFAMGIITAFLTAFYMFRLWFMFGDFVHFGHVEHLSIIDIFTAPLTWLSIIVALSGIGLAYMVYYKRRPSPTIFTATPLRRFGHKILVKKYWMDDLYIGFAERVVYGFSLVMAWFDDKIIDGAVNGISKGGIALGKVSNKVDTKVIDGTVTGISKVTFKSGSVLRKTHTGRVQDYAAVTVLGISALIILMMITGVI